jgi:fibronectin-binding autotransporter adhesin
MMRWSWFKILHLGKSQKPAPLGRQVNTREKFRPLLEALEERVLPSTFTVLNNNASGAGSLAGEISLALAGSGNIVNFSSSLSGGNTITLASALQISPSSAIQITIDDSAFHNVTVSGGNATQLFNIGATGDVTIKGLTLEDGKAQGSSGSVPTNGQGGAIDNAGTLVLAGDTIKGNKALGGNASSSSGQSGGSGQGGGIYNSGTLVLSSDSVQSNTAQGGGGSGKQGGSGQGGGIYNDLGSVTVQGTTTIQGNLAAGGNGGANHVAGNGGAGQGGGVYTVGSANVNLSGTAFASNSATGGTGGAGSGASLTCAVWKKALHFSRVSAR